MKRILVILLVILSFAFNVKPAFAGDWINSIVFIDNEIKVLYQIGKKIIVCHKPRSDNPITILIAKSSLKDHLGHGDHVGSCWGQSPEDANDENDT